MNHVVNFLNLLRVKQWLKNLFVFFPLIFSGRLFRPDLALDSLLTFLGFCGIAGGIYILNDLMDVEADRIHPKKAARPLAGGACSAGCARGVMFLATALGLLLCSAVSPFVLSVAVVYIALHLGYNYFAKRMVLVDVIFVAVGYHLRIWAGSVAAGVLPSVWLQTCVFLIALFLALAKRKSELNILRERAVRHRGALAHYPVYVLDQLIMITATLTVVFYSLYTFSSDDGQGMARESMVYSLVFVIYGIFRYIYLVNVKKTGDDPGDVILSDRASLVNLALWVIYIVFMLYYPFGG